MVGDIHLVPVSFSGHSGVKVRPVLLLKRNSYGDALFVPLTTNLTVGSVRIDSSHLTSGSLLKPSVVVVEKKLASPFSASPTQMCCVTSKAFGWAWKDG